MGCSCRISTDKRIAQSLCHSRASCQRTTGNNYKLQKFVYHYNLSKYSVCLRVVNVWNSLPNNVVQADTINIFKNRLDKHWLNQEVLFNFIADLTGSENVRICMWTSWQDVGKADSTCTFLWYLIGLDCNPGRLIGWKVTSKCVVRSLVRSFHQSCDMPPATAEA